MKLILRFLLEIEDDLFFDEGHTLDDLVGNQLGCKGVDLFGESREIVELSVEKIESGGM
jgi:hypothetical protein